MKKILIVMVLIIFSSCKEKTLYYKNIDSGKIYTESEFSNLGKTIIEKYRIDSLVDLKINRSLKKRYSKNDSIIQPFGLDVRVGENYIISTSNKDKIYDLIGQNLPEFELKTINDKFISKTDILDKPCLINFWFTQCQPCIEEIPELNRLKEKYSDRVNFIAITFNDKTELNNFLKQTKFDFIQIINAQEYIDEVGIRAFPKNVFIDKIGKIRLIENGLSGNFEQFEKYLNNLL
ncbi:TlpA disulfide reductase family protein [Lutibacter sp.]|uniref:TlpA family protein disulfide reductase n=1 Tax=Lutibacter sp. TaxID=1925666 RepID=UPI001A321309|nr:TlpA disulfide reductase family protein [Lutibacter sp.]MBI9041828.1 TlpA family protein disulfide reductase [Lutibacter sp.]